MLEAVRDGSLPAPRVQHYRSRLPLLEQADAAGGVPAGVRLVCPGDEEWPPQLSDLCDVSPLALWVRGGDLRSAGLRSLAVVGARACTPYGEHVAAELAAVVAERGWTVVSGAAYGIDAAAHRGALAVQGRTVAVLACGVDVAYPRGHAALLQRVLDEGGTVVSELAPGERVTRTRFLERNRLIAALTRGTVVVEAAPRSGARSTAGHARGLGRYVMAVPGPVTSAASAGCHEEIRTSNASLVANGEHVLDLVGELGVDTAEPARGAERAHDALAPDALRVLEALPARRSLGVETIVLRAGLSVPTVLAALTELAAAGLARQTNSGWRLDGKAEGTC